MPRKFKNLPAASGGPPETPANFVNLPAGGGADGDGTGRPTDTSKAPGGAPAAVRKFSFGQFKISRTLPSAHTPPKAAMRETQPADVAMHEVTVEE